MKTEEIFNLRKGMGDIFGIERADELWFKELLPDKKLRELIEKRIEDIEKHESFYGVFNDYIKPEFQKLLEESKT